MNRSAHQNTNIDKKQRHLVLWACIVVPVFFGLLVLMLGQDADWDLMNYHFYDPYAWITGRVFQNIAPAGLQSYYNPFLDVPFYYVIRYWPAWVAGVTIGTVQGLNFILILAIVRRALPVGSRVRSAWPQILIAFAGLLGAQSIGELGTLMGDNITSLFVFGSLLGIFWSLMGDPTPRHRILGLFLSGIIMGLGAGFKLTNSTYAVGACLALLLPALPGGRLIDRFLLAFDYGVGVLAGLGATGGYWFYKMWTVYHNPLFPYWNNWFRSPYALSSSYNNYQTSFVPHSLINIVLAPFTLERFEGLFFREYGPAVLYVLFLLWGVKVLFVRWRRVHEVAEAHQSPDSRIATYLLAMVAISYVVWLRVFAYMRYFIPLEMLVPLGIWLLVGRLLRERRAANMVAAALVFFVSVPGSVFPVRWGRVGWAQHYFAVKMPKIGAKSVVLIAGPRPISYVIPYLPKTTVVVSPDGLGAPTLAYRQLVQRRLAASPQERLYLIYGAGRTAQKTALYRVGAEKAIGQYGLVTQKDSCRTLETHIGTQAHAIVWCSVGVLKSPRWTRQSAN
ncbi:MAG: hypothetical protein ACYCXX_10300 [Acidiferrobacter thiooxydans]|jgi:hypothetical protein|uniref:hypothetical protein n=1 Tax=Acidiferrobacter sp. SPIII_3 TaxID=1281578 RepID=UPI000D72D2B8|nr:hypothetical protein [Acidiferrobacter sp. SPIII_3]AWP21985.1 hypothetical protein C4901_00350 [Acidiferrobacter sp. SPIII_3]MDA8190045.1 hypothetical protein [Gammaproteobacteria bacterium]